MRWLKCLPCLLFVVMVVACAAAPVTPAPAATETPPATEPAPAASPDPLDDYLGRLAGLGFRGAVLVARGAEVVLAQGYGPQGRTGTPALTPDTLFNIGSVSKTFTAAAILKLQDQGRLSVQDALADHLSGVPDDKAGLTLHQLLTHTAGLDDFRLGQGDLDPLGKDAALAAIFNRPLLLPPGQETSYSNHGYILLAAVVEAAAGQPFRDFVRTELLAPAGLDSTGWWGPDPVLAGQPRASGVDNGQDLGDSANFPSPGWSILGAGGMVSTVNDLFRWHQAVQGGAVLTPEASVAYTQPQFEVNEQQAQSYGWVLVQTAPGAWVGVVNGDTPEVAQTTTMAWDMAADVVVVVNASSSTYPAGVVQRSVRRLARGGEVAQPPAIVALEPAALAALAGTYTLPEGGALEVSVALPGLRVAATDTPGFALLFPAEVFGPAGEPLDLAAVQQRTLDYLASGRAAEVEQWKRRQAAELGAFTGLRVLGTATRPGGAEPWTYVYFDFEGGARLTAWVISPQGVLEIGDLAVHPPAVDLFPVSPTQFVTFSLGTPPALSGLSLADGVMTGETEAGTAFVARR